MYGDFSELAPELLIVLSLLYILVILALELGGGRSKKLLATESLDALQVTLISALAMYALLLILSSGVNILDGLYHVDFYVTGLKMLTLLCGLAVMNSSQTYLASHPKHLLEFPILLTQAILFMLLLISASHLISAFIALIGFSLNLYVLILFDGAAHASREAGIKYYYLSTFSSGLMIYGMFLIYIILSTGNFDEIANGLRNSAALVEENLSLLHLAIILTLVGFSFKLSAFPGHL